MIIKLFYERQPGLDHKSIVTIDPDGAAPLVTNAPTAVCANTKRQTNL